MSYSNYQLPNNYGYGTAPQPQPQQSFDPYASSAPPSTSNALVPMYGPPPTTNVSYSSPPPAQTPLPVDDSMAAIIASQERAMAEAKSRRKHPQEITSRKDYRVPAASTQRKPLSDAIHPHKYQMKKERKTKTAAGATSGAIVGGIIAGPAFPVGMVLGGVAGGYAANKVSKFGERRAQRKHEQSNFRQAAQRAVMVQGDGVAFA